MKERPVNGQRAIIAHDAAPEVPQLCDGAFDDPTPLVATQLASVLGGRADAIPLVRAAQFDAPPPRLFKDDKDAASVGLRCAMAFYPGQGAGQACNSNRGRSFTISQEREQSS
jgi:hypothetical protein